MWRNLLILGALLGGVYLYGLNYGLALGIPPFTPVYYLNHSAEMSYGLRVAGGSDAVKIKLEGNLKKGRVAVWLTHQGRRLGKVKVYKGSFRDQIKYKVEDGFYTVHVKTQEAEGTVRYDWVSTRFQAY
ncbi:hypothetical protein [Oceanithermus profundus]|uniref:Uncharacterized protein n=1 Tax=Oceanithermus profundus (strain DSM 14977 / NBRC 100410 / VKM B-2274 / 506) TaxID=670487 RepID=E4U813_OCEP5|nr:hypothetical protein [Oceanithermus profundus]ADR36103.1 hypothetical protein Ocepr_0645 [Oceanithermus profundus DSM 14977]